MQRLRDLMIEYKFVMSWDEDQSMSKGRGGISSESAMANVSLLMNGSNGDENDQEMGDGEVKKAGK